MDIEILNYSPGSINTNTELWEKIDDSGRLALEVIARLKYSPDKDVIGYQFDFTVTYKDELTVKTGFLFGLKIKDFSKYLNDALSKEQKLKSIEEITTFIWPYVVGAFSARCGDKGIRMILPPVNAEKFAEDVILIKSE